jgi:hypothetical protein
MRWTSSQIRFELQDEQTDAPVVTVDIFTPAGKISLMADVEDGDRMLTLRLVHMQSEAGPNAIGLINLRIIAQAFLQEYGYDTLIVEGAVRTTGARPGHRPRTFRFTR